MDILNSCIDSDEIQFMEDGSWCPMKPKREKQDMCQPATYSGIETTGIFSVSSDMKHVSESKKRVEVIDLTLDSSSDEDEPPAKKPCPVSAMSIHTSAGHKGVISIDHQPSSVLRSPPMATIGNEYLSTLPIPDYHRSYQVPSDIQGLDLFSFLQTEPQHYSPSVITSLDEQDTLSHFFQYRSSPSHYMTPLTQAMGGSHGAAGSAGRISSIVSTSSLRESHSGSQSASSTMPGCRSDIISLD
ncbi:E3 SUMO-protein ligase PIAS3 [Discoglossus pictus]